MRGKGSIRGELPVEEMLALHLSELGEWACVRIFLYGGVWMFLWENPGKGWAVPGSGLGQKPGGEKHSEVAGVCWSCVWEMGWG